MTSTSESRRGPQLLRGRPGRLGYQVADGGAHSDLGDPVRPLVGDSATAPSLTDFSDFSRRLSCYSDQLSEVGKMALYTV